MEKVKERRLLYFANIFIPILYVVLMLMLLNDSELGVSGYTAELLILISGCSLTFILSLGLIIKRWNDTFNQKQMVKDFLCFAVLQLPAIGCLIYCIYGLYFNVM
ncbi:hypothetical protein RJI07_04650 [Mycoplasmatota bacterium WC30]